MENEENNKLFQSLEKLSLTLSDIADSLEVIANNSGGRDANHLSELNHTLKLIYEHLEDRT
jgi:hypothetical protein